MFPVGHAYTIYANLECTYSLMKSPLGEFCKHSKSVLHYM